MDIFFPTFVLFKAVVEHIPRQSGPVQVIMALVVSWPFVPIKRIPRNKIVMINIIF